MNRISQFIHDNQIVIAALILFMAVIVYCLFNRYDYKPGNSHVVGGYVIDHLTGKATFK